MIIRPLQPRDRLRIQDIVHAVGNFNPAETDVAMELVDDALQKGSVSDYIVYVLEKDAAVCGYACFGKTPLTDSTFDFYWMAVDPLHQRQGLGRALIRFVEEEVQRRGGAMLILETSSLETYRRTVRIYELSGYTLTARIPNFYRQGDDKLIYIKTFFA